MGKFWLTISRQMESVLEGNLQNPSDELREEAKSTPTTNAASERIFSSIDRLISERPHATTLNLESTVLWKTNQTIIQYNEDNSPQPILEQQKMSVVEMQDKLKSAKEAIKLKIEKLNFNANIVFQRFKKSNVFFQ